MRRRSFLQLSVSSLATTLLTPSWDAFSSPARQFKISLNPGMIGVSAPLPGLIDFAIAHHFEAVSPPAQKVGDLSKEELNATLDKMRLHKLTWGSAGLPVDFRKDEATFADGVRVLKSAVPGLQRAGVTRMNTWIMPRHHLLTYRENFKLHKTRLSEIGRILADHNIRFGLEYVGPLTLRASGKYTFIHSLKELRELLSAINLPNVGVVLDSFHWYTAHETADDIIALSNAEVVACDLNDVPVGRTRDEQIDGQRMLPVATGMIDIKSFLEALVRIGFDGPVRAEPFNKELNDLPNGKAVAATSAAMHQAIDLIS